jgi:hypothetical protein
MVHVHLQFYLLQYLIFHFRLFDLYFTHNLDGINTVGLFFLSDIDIAESTTAQFFTQSEVIDLDLCEIRFFFLYFLEFLSHA